MLVRKPLTFVQPLIFKINVKKASMDQSVLIVSRSRTLFCILRISNLEMVSEVI